MTKNIANPIIYVDFMWNSKNYADNKELWFEECEHLPEIDILDSRIQKSLKDCGLFLLRSSKTFNAEETLNLAKKLGTPVNQSPEEAYIFEVKNEGFDPSHPKFRGPSSNMQLSFHTDRCDIIMFHCIRQASEGGVNQFVHADTVYEVLKAEDPAALKTLENSFSYKRHNADPAHPFSTYELPVFDFSEDGMAATLMTYLIEKADTDPDLPNISAEQRHALNKLQEICHRPENQLEMKLQAGDFLFLNNIKMFHSRTAFKDNSAPRLYYRVWLSVPWSQKLPDSFINLFGSVEGGSVRGGFRKF